MHRAGITGLEEALIPTPIFHNLDFTKPIILQTDTSEIGLGAMISQVFEGNEHPMLFISHKLTLVEKKHATLKR